MPPPIAVLVVDDEPDLSDLAKSMLERSGDFKVHTVLSAQEAREELSARRYDAIVSDYQMPKENGIEFLYRLRASGDHIPFILFTGKGREEVVIEAIDKGADSYMQKGGETRSVFAELAHKIRGAVGRSRAESALRESESHYRSLINGSPVGLMLTDREGNCIYANRKWLEMTTLALEDVKDKGWQARIPPDERGEVMERWRRSLESEGARSFEYRLVGTDREEIWLLANAAPIYGLDGTPTTFVSTNIDITARRQAEEELIGLKEMLEVTESISKVGGWKYDLATQQVEWTNEVYHIYAVDRNHDPNDYRDSASFYVGEDAQRVLSAFEAACTGVPYDLELRLRRANGEKVFVRTIGRPVLENGCVVAVVGSIMDITERKVYEETILERERTIAQASSLAKVGHWIWREATGEFILSDGLCLLLGIDKGAALPHDYFFQTVHPEDRVMVINALDAALKGRRKFDLEHRMVRSNGGTIMVRDMVEVTSTAGNRPMFMLGMVQDITEIRAAGDALQESKNLYRTLVDTVAEGIIMLAANGDVLACNSEAARIMGVDPDNALADLSDPSRWNLMGEGEEDLAQAQRPFFLTLSLGVPLSHRIMGLRRGDEVRWISMNTRPLFRNREDIPYAAVASFSDITERKRTQDSLRENEVRYRELVEMAPFPVMIARLEDDRILLVNEQMQRKFLMSKEVAMQSRARSLYADPMDRVNLIAALKRYGHVAGFEARMRDEGGCQFWASISASQTMFEGHAVSFVSFTDITERRQAQEEAQMANRKLNLVNDITRHDALNQLTAMQGNLALLRRKGLNKEQEELVQRVLDSTRNMTGQLGFAKLYQDIGKQKPGWQSLLSSVRKAQAASTHTELAVSFPERDLLIWADPMFEKVALNLMDNAARHGKARHLDVMASEVENALLIEFADDGTGIGADKRQGLFERGHGGRHGNGLFLARDILSITGIGIEEMGAPGQGAHFVMRVPPGKWSRGEGPL